MPVPTVQPPIQSEFPQIFGSPEGRIFGPVGYVVIDARAGDMYIKRSSQDLNTGWKRIKLEGE